MSEQITNKKKPTTIFCYAHVNMNKSETFQIFKKEKWMGDKNQQLIGYSIQHAMIYNGVERKKNGTLCNVKKGWQFGGNQGKGFPKGGVCVYN